MFLRKEVLLLFTCFGCSFSHRPLQPIENKGESTPVAIDWVGSFLDPGSLSHVNRKLTEALAPFSEFEIHCVQNKGPISPEFARLAPKLLQSPSSSAALTVRHGWPADWSRPLRGKLVVIQPWEWGALPKKWVEISSQVDEFWVPSEFVRQEYVQSGIPLHKINVIPNGIDPKIFHPEATPREGLTEKKFRFLFVGATIWRKGIDVLLRAYLKEFTAKDDVCLVIKDFGTTTFYKDQTITHQIRALQKKEGAPEIVYIEEELPLEALPGIYTASHCLVHPYRGEGFGLPVLEAMACGLPVIATGGGATDDFVREEFGFRLPSKRRVFGRIACGLELNGEGWVLEPDLLVLREKMRYLYEHPEEAKAKGAAANLYATTTFSWDKAAQRIQDRIEKLVETEEAIRPSGEIRFYGEASQDRFVHLLLYKLLGKQDEGYYLDIGAGHPTAYNNSYSLEKYLGWHGVSIDQTDRYNGIWSSERKSCFLNENALEADYRSILKPFPSVIDYLSLDIDGNYDAVLERIPFDDYTFKVITIEHDSYRFGDHFKNKERKILQSLGYHLLCPDVFIEPALMFEDWWIHPSAFPADLFSHLLSLDLKGKYHDEIIQSLTDQGAPQ